MKCSICGHETIKRDPPYCTTCTLVTSNLEDMLRTKGGRKYIVELAEHLKKEKSDDNRPSDC